MILLLALHCCSPFFAGASGKAVRRQLEYTVPSATSCTFLDKRVSLVLHKIQWVLSSLASPHGSGDLIRWVIRALLGFLSLYVHLSDATNS